MSPDVTRPSITKNAGTRQIGLWRLVMGSKAVASKLTIDALNPQQLNVRLRCGTAEIKNKMCPQSVVQEVAF